MKKIKSYFVNLPKGVKLVLGINLIVYLITILLYTIFNVKLQDYFGLYPTYSENFNLLQLITCPFIHSITSFLHILLNMLFFLIFAPSVENRFGTKFFIFVYFICSFLGCIFVNHAYYENKNTINNNILKVGITPKDIKINDGYVSKEYLETLNHKQKYVVMDYDYVISKSYGASSAVFGFIIIYIILNLTNFKKILFNVLGLYLIYVTINGILINDEILNGSHYAHFGGMVGGLIFYLYMKIKKDTVSDIL